MFLGSYALMLNMVRWYVTLARENALLIEALRKS